jgi:hypothetical protein
MSTEPQDPSGRPDPLEQQLRDHFRRAASAVTTTVDPADELELLRREAADRSAGSRRRRVGTASVASVAAVALAIGLVVQAQGPQPLSSTGAADGPGVAGVATGSATGSATGVEKGWTSSFTDDPAEATGLPMLVPVLDGAGDEQLSSFSAVTSSQGDGRDAAPLAVLAELRVGQPLRFVTASVQSVDELGPGDGVERTVAGRVARVIVDNHGWLRLVWDLDDEHRALVQAYGVDQPTLDVLLGTLAADETGSWVMDPGATGLAVVAAPTPTEQRSLSLSWSDEEPTGGAVDESTGRATTLRSTTSMDLATGGEYEFWASLSSRTPWLGGDPSVIDVDLGGEVVPGVLMLEGSYQDGTNDALLSALSPQGVVVRLHRYESGPTASGATADARSSVAVLRDAARFQVLDESAWANLLARAAAVSQAQEEAMQREIEASGRRVEDPSTLETLPPSTTVPPSTTAPASNGPTTSRLPGGAAAVEGG